MPAIDKFSLGLGVAAGIAAAGVLVLLRRKKAKPIAPNLTVYYWPMKGRAGSVIRILRAAGVPVPPSKILAGASADDCMAAVKKLKTTKHTSKKTN